MMDYTGLVKRLRNPPFGTETSERNMMTAAADAIDALKARVATVEKQAWIEVRVHERAAAERDAAERKVEKLRTALADVVEALAQCEAGPRIEVGRAALAETEECK